MTSITRIYRFSASHRLHCDGLSEAENNRLYGKCNNPFGNGHDYVLEVTATGDSDPLTGRIVNVAALDGLVQQQVLRRLANRNLNLDLPEFANLVPTTENLALTVAALLEQQWTTYFRHASARLSRVHVQETGRNGFEVLVPAPARRLAPQLEMEKLHA
jgi:6-pyruvoyltetrahydropterin/6-carboxytetrahydropterin synthase